MLAPFSPKTTLICNLSSTNISDDTHSYITLSVAIEPITKNICLVRSYPPIYACMGLQLSLDMVPSYIFQKHSRTDLLFTS